MRADRRGTGADAHRRALGGATSCRRSGCLTPPGGASLIRAVCAASSEGALAEGLSNREIAEELVISEKTVQRHRANIMEKLGMRDRVELTRYAIRRGLIEP